MPKKERRQREAQRRADEEAFAQIPDHINNLQGDGNLKGITSAGIYEGGLVCFDSEGCAYLHPDIGRGGNDLRHDDTKELAEALKGMFPGQWRKRGSAKFIALTYSEGKPEEEQISEVTVRRYMRQYP